MGKTEVANSLLGRKVTWAGNEFTGWMRQAEIVGVYKHEGAVWLAVVVDDNGESREVPFTAVMVVAKNDER